MRSRSMAISFSSGERKRAFIGESGSHMYTTTENNTKQCVSDAAGLVKFSDIPVSRPQKRKMV